VGRGHFQNIGHDPLVHQNGGGARKSQVMSISCLKWLFKAG